MLNIILDDTIVSMEQNGMADMLDELDYWAKINLRELMLTL